MRRHIGALCDALTAADLAPGWTAATLLDAIDTHNTEHGRYAIPAHRQRNPLALLVYQLRTALAGRTPPATRPDALRRSQHADHAERVALDQAATAAAVPPTAAYLAARAALKDARTRPIQCGAIRGHVTPRGTTR